MRFVKYHAFPFDGIGEHSGLITICRIRCCDWSLHCWSLMMTSSNGIIVRVNGPLCEEFTAHRWIPFTKASDAELWCFLWSRLNKRLSKPSRRRWFETPSCPLWRHCNGIPTKARELNLTKNAKMVSAVKHHISLWNFNKVLLLILVRFCCVLPHKDINKSHATFWLYWVTRDEHV